MKKRPIRSKSNYAFHHYNSAKFFCEQLREIEEGLNDSDIDTLIQHQAYASGAILSSVAFLESAINTFIPDADTNKFPMDSFNIQTGEVLSGLWPYVERKSILDKYQIALTAACRTLFKPGQPPLQDAALLIHLRNALVHFKPEWDDELEVHLKIEKQLRNKFQLNPLVENLTTMFFPTKCLGYGCAQWAVESAEKLVSEFYKRMNTEFLLDHLIPR